MLRLSTLFICLILFSFTAFAQTGKSYHTQQYTTENGMPSNGIKGLEWDEETGFLWIATEAGIARFNGIDFKSFSQQNTPTITSERIGFLTRNNAGRIYTADQAGNIHYIIRNKIAFLSKLPTFINNVFDNRFTLSISDTFFKRSRDFNTKASVSFLYSRFLPVTDTSCFVLHGNRLYWFSASADSLVPYGKTALFVRASFKIENRAIFMSKDLQFNEIYQDTARNHPLSFDNNVISATQLFNGSDRIYWTNGMKYPIVINRNNAWKLSLSGNKIIPTLICSDVPVDALIPYAQYSEKQKKFFLGTESKGLFIITLNKVDPMKSIESRPNERNSYYSQIELQDGNVLTSEGHIVGIKNSSTSPLPVKGKFSFYTSLSGDSLLWYSQFPPGKGYSCLHRLNKKTGETIIYHKIRGADIIVYPMIDGQWLIASEAGIGTLVNDSVHYLYRHKAANYNTTIYNLTEISKEKFLIASCSGILQFDLTTKKMDTLLKSGGSCIRSLWKYGDYIFLGSYGNGFYIWKNGVLKRMPLDKRKYLLYSHCFVPDEYGFCWISSNRGLFKVSINDLINAYETNNPVVYYHYFGKADGMDMIEMNGGCTPCALELKNKTISFPTMDGLLWVNPVKAEPVLPDGQIFIDKIIADSIELDPDKTNDILLPAKTNDISISFSFSAWCNKENIYIDYQLNDTVNWKPINTDNEALLQFSKLPPGDYTLRLRKLNGFGINNYSYKEINFTISTPWHQQWWFYILLILFVTGLFILYFRFRTNQFKIRQRKLEQQVSEKTKELQDKNEILEKNNSIKTRLISIISHDIVTPLKFVTAAGKNLIEKRKLMPEELQQETIQEMTNTSQELHLLSTNILNWIKYQNENRRMTKETFPIHELVKQVLGILNSLAHQKGLRIVNDIDPELTIYQFYEPLKILVYNLLTNAIHFSERGTITVRAELKQSNIFLSVQDEGAGMPPEKIQSLMEDHIVISSANVDNKKGHGLGFLIIKDLLKTMGASLHIESTVGVGSKISIIIPV